MLDEVVTSVATGAAGNIIAYMLNGPVDALRAQMTKMFRHGTPQERSAVLRRLDDDSKALIHHEITKSTLTGQWAGLLASYLAQHPEALYEVENFSRHDASRTVIIDSQINHDGLLVNGSNNGYINFGRNA